MKKKDIQLEIINSLNEQLKNPEKNFHINENTYPLISYVNQIIELVIAKNHTDALAFVDKIENELKKHKKQLDKEYVSLVEKYILVVYDFCCPPEHLEFFFNEYSVGTLWREPCKTEEIIDYEPFRGSGHFELIEELDLVQKAICELYVSGLPVLIQVSRVPNRHSFLVEMI